MRPKPVTKPSPAGRCSCMPKSTQRWRTNLSSSSKVPSSSNRWMRSRAASLPALCSRSRRSGPPPASASAEIRRSSSMRSLALGSGMRLRFVSDNRTSLGRDHGWGFFPGENADGEMRGEPDGTEEQDDAKEQLRGHCSGSVERRLQRSHVDRGAHEDEHSGEGHRHDEDRGHNGSKDRFHETGSKPPCWNKDSAREAITSVHSSES